MHIDTVNRVDARLADSHAATSGRTRLEAFNDARSNYISEIYSVAVAPRAIKASDQEAAAVWNEWMRAVRHGCAVSVAALANDGALKSGLCKVTATDLLWTLLTVENWERLVRVFRWTQLQFSRPAEWLFIISDCNGWQLW